MTRLVHRAALWLERQADRLRGRRRRRRPDAARVVHPYLGYATPDRLCLRGRVLSRVTRRPAASVQGRLANLRNMLALFLTDELAGVTLCHGAAETRSDEEGYFTLALPRAADGPAGWRAFTVDVEGCEMPVTCRCLVPRADARWMVISDIDDTVLHTGAWSLARNLWTTLTGNATTRHIFPDAVALMRSLSEGGRNPVYYVSSSPWNMHAFLEEVFAGARLVSGPMFLRDFGLGQRKFISGGHGTHKGESIDLLLAANPGLPTILIGDTGQADARIYCAAIARHPGRIAAVVLREPREKRARGTDRDVAALRETGVPLLIGPDFDGVAEALNAVAEAR